MPRMEHQEVFLEDSGQWDIKSWLTLDFTFQDVWALYRAWHPTPVLLPGKSHGRRSLVGCSPWGRTVSDNPSAGEPVPEQRAPGKGSVPRPGDIKNLEKEKIINPKQEGRK